MRSEDRMAEEWGMILTNEAAESRAYPVVDYSRPRMDSPSIEGLINYNDSVV